MPTPADPERLAAIRQHLSLSEKHWYLAHRAEEDGRSATAKAHEEISLNHYQSAMELRRNVQ